MSVVGIRDIWGEKSVGFAPGTSQSDEQRKAGNMKSYVITPAAGKRLIATAIAQRPDVISAVKNGTVVIIAGTTNGYVAEEILNTIGQAKGFSRRYFFRGVTLPPTQAITETGRMPDESRFPGDVVITHGEWQQGKTLFDVLDGLKEGDIIMKGANAVNPASGQAAVLVGHPKGGTIVAALQAVTGRRVRLLIPVGLEKRVHDDLNRVARLMNEPGSVGPRIQPIVGEIVTELEAIKQSTGCNALLLAAGGVSGAEGAVWIGVQGPPEQMAAAETLLMRVAQEPPFVM